MLLGVGGQLTVNQKKLYGLLRKVLSHSESGNHASGKGESPCGGAETTQPKENAMIQFVVEVSLGFDETANLLLEQAQIVGSVIQTAYR